MARRKKVKQTDTYPHLEADTFPWSGQTCYRVKRGVKSEELTKDELLLMLSVTREMVSEWMEAYSEARSALYGLWSHGIPDCFGFDDRNRIDQRYRESVETVLGKETHGNKGG